MLLEDLVATLLSRLIRMRDCRISTKTKMQPIRQQPKQFIRNTFWSHCAALRILRSARKVGAWPGVPVYWDVINGANHIAQEINTLGASRCLSIESRAMRCKRWQRCFRTASSSNICSPGRFSGQAQKVVLSTCFGSCGQRLRWPMTVRGICGCSVPFVCMLSDFTKAHGPEQYTDRRCYRSFRLSAAGMSICSGAARINIPPGVPILGCSRIVLLF